MINRVTDENNNNMQRFTEITVKFVQDSCKKLETVSDEPTGAPMDEEARIKAANIQIPHEGRDLEAVVRELNEDIMSYGNNCSHRRFFGFIPGNTSPLSWLGDIITSAWNRHAGSAANQPAVWETEQSLIKWLSEKAGFPETAGGIFVSGGSMANLTAMTAARDSILAEEEWPVGTAYVSEQTHSSVAKGLRIAGIGNKRIRSIPVNSDFRMDTSALRRAVAEDVKNGYRPFLAVATAGTTNTGSIDPFDEIRSICDEYGMWMHVDGAFGASALLSEKYSCRLNGLEKADSLSWDAHKWLFQTFGCGIVLVRDKATLLSSFSVHPEYLKDFESDETLINPWDLGIELTRPARVVKLWLTLQVMGTDAVSDAVSHGIEAAEWAESAIKNDPLTEIIAPARLAIVNFRYRPAGFTEEQTAALNSAIAEKITSSGYAGIYTTELNGIKVLRMCTLHPDITKEEIEKTVKMMSDCCRELKEKI